MQRRTVWQLAWAGMSLGGLAMLAGTVGGGDLGPLTAAYGLLLALVAMAALAGLAIHDRVVARLERHDPHADPPLTDRLQGRRVF